MIKHSYLTISPPIARNVFYYCKSCDSVGLDDEYRYLFRICFTATSVLDNKNALNNRACSGLTAFTVQ